MLLLFHISLSADIFWYCMLFNLLKIIIYVCQDIIINWVEACTDFFFSSCQDHYIFFGITSLNFENYRRNHLIKMWMNFQEH